MAANELAGTLLNERSLAWAAMTNLIRRSGLPAERVARASELSRGSLSPPRDLCGGSSDARTVSMTTAHRVQQVLHAHTPADHVVREEFARISLLGLVARLRLELDRPEVQAPSRWLPLLEHTDDARGPEFELSPEELYLRVAALVSCFETLDDFQAIESTVEELGGRKSVVPRYIVPLIKIAAAPPGKGVEAITMLARIGHITLDSIDSEISKPWGFRLYRVLAYMIHRAYGTRGPGDSVPESKVSNLGFKTVHRVIGILKDADGRIENGTEVDAYPGRALQIDAIKEVLRLYGDAASDYRGPFQNAEFPDLVELLIRRVENKRRPTRERCYALWLLDHLDRRWLPADELKRVDTTGDDALTWSQRSMATWRRNQHTDLLSVDSGDHPALARLVEQNLDVKDGVGCGVSKDVGRAAREHVMQGLLTPNGRWRRQVADTLRTGLMHRSAAGALRAVLTSDQPMWIKDRAAFLLGFMQEDSELTQQALVAFAQQHAESPDKVTREAAHAAVFAIADIVGLRPVILGDHLDYAQQAVGLFEKVLFIEPHANSDTRIDLGGAYGLAVTRHLRTELGVGPLPKAHCADQAELLAGEWTHPVR